MAQAINVIGGYPDPTMISRQGWEWAKDLDEDCR
jgi:hypothetical protein